MGNSPEQNCSHRLLSRKSNGEPNWECRVLMEFKIEHPKVKVGCSDFDRPKEKCAIPVVIELARRSQKAEVAASISS